MNQPRGSEKGLEGSDPQLCPSLSSLSTQGHLASQESGSGHLHLTFFLITTGKGGLSQCPNHSPCPSHAQ